jgi:hypothetical protein
MCSSRLGVFYVVVSGHLATKRSSLESEPGSTFFRPLDKNSLDFAGFYPNITTSLATTMDTATSLVYTQATTRLPHPPRQAFVYKGASCPI